MACHDVSIGNPCDAGFVLSEPSLYTYSLAGRGRKVGGPDGDGRWEGRTGAEGGRAGRGIDLGLGLS